MFKTKYMPNDLFDYCVYGIAKKHVHNALSIPKISEQFFNKYKNSYLNDRLIEQWIESTFIALGRIDMIFPQIAKEGKITTLDKYQQSLARFHPDGKKREHWFFIDNLFTQQSMPNYKRIESFSESFDYYSSLIDLGIAP